MKKNFLLCTALSFCIFTACTSASSSASSYPDESDDAFIEGQEYVVSCIKNGAKEDYTYYVDAELLEEIIQNYYGDEGEEIRDAILFHPDVQMYSAEDIVNKAIEHSGIQ